ncbi:hypothetical protein [Olivibacter domesticus]|uniref:Uncharacterized protein n=1 Tax=Olivibacter domesticus TaxID=407022 RepID=A0A1H7VU97_OLID1|nr:hypothetical protein [Olivibacter domesticus]SEM12348.1 hypothetical protein SAMN05661044_04334 [Olivibacter domesticus]
MTTLNTNNPYALRFLLNETVYAFEIAKKDEEPNQEPLAEVSPAYQFLGGNKNQILYIINNSKHEYFSTAAHDAFSKTINALGLSMEDIAVLNVGNYPPVLYFDQICTYFDPRKVILAGASPTQLALNGLLLNDPTTLNNIRVLYTFSFEEMLTDIEKKKTFWQQVKTL